jgi:hypothetical protein
MALTAAQKAKLRTAKAVITGASGEATVYGSLGNLEYLGFTPDSGMGALSLMGTSRSVVRRAGRRSRWLGDSAGVAVSGSTAQVAFYPSKHGQAIAGTPVKVVNLENTYADTGKPISAQLQLDGKISVLIEWLTAHPRAFPMQVYGKTGNAYSGIILAD